MTLIRSWPLWLLAGANGLILVDAPPPVRYGAALILLAFLPGWGWTRLLSRGQRPLLEQLVLSVGLSLALSIVGAMLAVYLPGPLTLGSLLVMMTLITLAGLGAAFFAPAEPRPANPQLPRLALILLVGLIIITAGLRLPRLGYAEFHEDEAEALMLGVRLLQGEDYALFLHRKGPAQMLLPVAFWLATDRITEAMARFPFALGSLASVLVMFLLGWRWHSWQAGLIAGLLWAVNGYSIAFARMVQYQALIFFLGPLALYCLHLAWKEAQPRWYLPAALLLAASLLAHFDALLLLPVAGYLALRALPRAGVMPLLAGVLFLGLLAAFYIPYTLDPEFSNTTAYLTDSRIRPGLLYNNLDTLRHLDKEYSSRFFLGLVGVGILLMLVTHAGLQSRKAASRKLPPSPPWKRPPPEPVPATRFILPASLGLLALTTALWPGFWAWGANNWAGLIWLVFGLVVFWQLEAVPFRTAWLLAGVPFLGYGFLVDDPRTHVYIIYPGLTLLAGPGYAALLKWRRPLALAGLSLAGVGVLLTGWYVAAIFLPTESRLAALRQRWDTSPWETIYDDVPGPRSYFGYPKLEGWKAIGVADFPGDFRSVNEDFIVPIWYNFGQPRSCYETPAYFFVRAEAEAMAPAPGYTRLGGVRREGETRLHIFTNRPAEPQTYDLAPLVPRFDRRATPAEFIQQAEPSQPVNARFGEAIVFTGYDLPTSSVAPGETLYLNLYWQARAAPGPDYRAFVHLVTAGGLLSQQDDTPVCRLPTSLWRPGQRGMGQFRLAIPPDAAPGRYPLLIGLYQADTLERLPLTRGAAQPGDDFLWLGDITVTEARQSPRH